MLRALRCLSIVALLLASIGLYPAPASARIFNPAADDAATVAAATTIGPVIQLKSREFAPGAPDRPALRALARSDRERIHLLVQLDFIPREAAKAAYEQSGLKLLAYVPDYAWIASAPAGDSMRLKSRRGL